MSSLVLSGDTSGTVTVAAPAVAGTNTATLPAATGTVMVSGNMPAFSAWQSSSQTISSGTFTKIRFQTKEYDTANCYDNSTNFRFTPNVAGYYQVTGCLNMDNALYVSVVKNGTEFKRGLQYATGSSAANVTALVYLNGSTDYVEIYGYNGNASSRNTDANLYSTYFQAAMIRSA
jgi:hypothetical protein